MSKKIKYFVTVLFVLIAFIWFGKDFIINAIIQKIAEQRFSNHDNKWLTDGKVHLVIIGTGSPAAEVDVAQACVGLIYNKEFLIFDAGAGSARKAENLELPMKNLNAIFISHFHSDHIMDMDVWQNVTWRMGRKDSLYIYGANGISEIASGFNQALKADAFYRYENISSTGGVNLAFAKAKSFDPPKDDSLKLVYDSPNGIKVFAFNVSHQPVEPALGFRIEVNNKIIVYSGDTKKDLRMVKYANHADVLIHEAYNKDFVKKVLEKGNNIKPENKNYATLAEAEQTPHYHTDPKEVAELAELAKVKSIIFTHIIPPLGEGIVRQLFFEPLFLKGVKERFSGKYEIAKDGLNITL